MTVLHRREEFPGIWGQPNDIWTHDDGAPCSLCRIEELEAALKNTNENYDAAVYGFAQESRAYRDRNKELDEVAHHLQNRVEEFEALVAKLTREVGTAEDRARELEALAHANAQYLGKALARVEELKHVVEVYDDRNKELEAELYQAKANWSDEQKRSRELETEVERLERAAG